MVNSFNQEMTAEMQAPLKIDGKTIGSIGLALFGEPLVMEQEKLVIFEQFATVAAIALKNALAHQQARYQAFHDPLTGLPNRAYLNSRLEEEMQKARCNDASGAVMFIDLDDLKTVNDSFGHACGDDLIKAAAAQICGAVGPDAFVARVGGDEFIVILPGESNLRQIAQIADELLQAAQREYSVGGRDIHMSVSLGVTMYPSDGDQAQEILKNADNAMYAAKAAGRNCWRFYEAAMLKDAYEKLLLTNSLRHALERGEFSLHYQPQIALNDGEIIGFEALLRWQSQEHGAISPVRFIPLAEQSGLILPIGEWVFGEACRFAHKLANLGYHKLHVAVNVSPRQLADADFVSMVRRCLEEANIGPAQLEVEITENVLIESLEDSTRKLEALNALGIKLSLDDFGTGYSSLTYLRNLPVATLKIDKTFIDKILEDKVQEGFIRSIIDMAHVLGLNVVAEGVETQPQLTKLIQFDCDCVQGYLFSKPLAEPAAIEFVMKKTASA
jgi:diguanylate cyclase (GGDEF)-like protein